MPLLIFVLIRLKTLTRPWVEEGMSHTLHGADCGSSGGQSSHIHCIFPFSDLSPLHLLRHHACNLILPELYSLQAQGVCGGRHMKCCGRVSKQAVSDVTRCFYTLAEGSLCLDEDCSSDCHGVHHLRPRLAVQGWDWALPHHIEGPWLKWERGGSCGLQQGGS